MTKVASWRRGSASRSDIRAGRTREQRAQHAPGVYEYAEVQVIAARSATAIADNDADHGAGGWVDALESAPRLASRTSVPGGLAKENSAVGRSGGG